MSLDRKSLTYIDFATAAVYPVMMLMMMAQGADLIKRVSYAAHPYFNLERPGSTKE